MRHQWKWKYHGEGVLSKPRADGSSAFYVKYRFNGREIKEYAGETEQDARDQIKDIRKRIDRRKFEPPKTRRQRAKERGQLFREFARRFVEEYRSKGGSTYYRDQLFGNTSLVEPRRHTKAKPRAIVEFFGDMHLREITPQDIDRLESTHFHSPPSRV